MQLYLNPIHAVVQLRPSMEHLNAAGKRKNTVAASAEGGVKLEEATDQKSVGSAKKQVPLFFFFSFKLCSRIQVV